MNSEVWDVSRDLILTLKVKTANVITDYTGTL